MAGDNQRLAPGKVMARPEVASAATLLQELFDHAQRYSEAVRHFLPRAFLLVIGRQNPFAQIQRECFHTPTLPYHNQNSYTII